MRTQARAARLTIFVDEADQYRHRPLYVEIVHRAHRDGLAGATVLRGVEGFATISPVHTTHLFALGEHLPAMVILVDDRDRIEAFVDDLARLPGKMVALVDDVEVVRCSGAPRRG